MTILWHGSNQTKPGRQRVTVICRTILVATVAATLGLVAPVSAQNLVGRASRGQFGLKVGVISRMILRGERRLESEIASTMQVFADFPKGRGFNLNAAFDFYYVEINRSNQVMIEPSLGIKKSFRLKRSDLKLMPCASVGFAYLADIGDLPSSNFLTFKFLMDIHFKIDSRKAWIGELGILHAPRGSDGRRNITFGPGILLRVGVAFN